MENKFKKYIVKTSFILLLLLMFVGPLVTINATDFWKQAYNWLPKTDTGLMGNSIQDVINDVSTYVEIVGTLIITAATIVLGIRYMFASAEGKAMTKDNLVSLFVACILFFGWSGIQDLLINNNRLSLYTSTFSGSMSKIYGVFVFFAEVVAIVIILYFGIKYIFNGARGKADLKGKSVQFIIGMIFAFSAIEVLKLVSKIINKVV